MPDDDRLIAARVTAKTRLHLLCSDCCRDWSSAYISGGHVARIAYGEGWRIIDKALVCPNCVKTRSTLLRGDGI